VLYVARVFFEPAKPIPLAVWSGMYLYRELLNLFESQGVRFDHSSRKPFYLSPIFVGGRGLKYITSGILEPGKTYWFRFATADLDLASTFRTLVASGGLGDLRAFRIEESMMNSWSSNNRSSVYSNSGDKYHVVATLRFAPTVFKFEGNEAFSPSKDRFLASVARDIDEIWGTNIEAIAKEIAQRTEVLDSSVKKLRLSIGRGANGDRAMKAFAGTAVYLFALSPNEVGLVLDMLKLSEAIGVGKSRTLGFGFVSVEKVEVHRVPKPNSKKKQ